MKSDEVNSVLGVAERDPSTTQYPCGSLIQKILHGINASHESKETFMDKFTDHIIIELEVTKSAFWCYEKSFFEN